ncbi:DUF6498-containing protein [Adhaeretor mobilis]|uniref:DUF6498-containing protein n=1 Tax=Adhaeretor mobilis TaxID=1930276 RepID=UPI0011A76660|nr:DUF6498-containing protein [Adhaeretor mobilis]
MNTQRNSDGRFDAIRSWPWPWFPPSAALLLVSNFLPLIGVIWWEWSPFLVLALYWAENVAVGVTTALKMLWCTGGEAKERIASAGFFAMHYGIFTLVHGIFVLALGGFVGKEYYGAAGAQYSPWLIGTTALALVASHAYDFIQEFLIEGRGRHLGPGSHMWRPYPRMLVLHVAIVLGVFLAMVVGASWPVIALLVVLKTILDLVLQLVMRLGA